MPAPRPGTAANAREIARRLEAAQGHIEWRRHREPVGELVTTLLSHNTTDANQLRAFEALRVRYPTWDDVRRAPTAEVVATIRVAGLANRKGPRIQQVLDIVADDPRDSDLEWLGDVPLDEAMAFLTSLPGVGPKTAGCVMCFCFDAPVVPADTHVHRIALRTRIVPPRSSAARAQERLSRWIPPDLTYATHMHLVAHGRTICTARSPRCADCPLLDLCPEGRRRTAGMP
jgi:endonuclease-3